MQVIKTLFGKVNDHIEVDLYTLTNGHGTQVEITNYGGIIKSILVPDRKGNLGDIVLGFDNLKDYLTQNPFFGCIAGRFANRIKNAQFSLAGIDYQLAQNDNPHHLHGGIQGFDKVIWDGEGSESSDKAALRLSYLSKDGEEGYPGNLAVTVLYSLTDDDRLEISYHATTDQTTIVNLTNHTYFNLAGQGDILSHELLLNASQFTPVDNTLIPTGEYRSVADTPFDFRKPMEIGSRIENTDEQLRFGKGYDHNFVIDQDKAAPTLAASVFERLSGRRLEVYTTQPGVQFYSGNFLTTDVIGKAGAIYDKRSGFCLETQHFPDAPNQPGFPPVDLHPGHEYQHTTVFAFSV